MRQDGDSSPPDPRERELAERGRLLVARATEHAHASDALRERIAADRERLRPVRRRRRALLLSGSLGSIAAAAAAVVLVVGPGGPTGPPTVLDAAELALAEPTMPAPARDTARPVLLRAEMAGVAFPEWDTLGWRAVGARRDEVSGREAMTVFYEGGRGARAAYTILGGEPVETPADAEQRTVNDIPLEVLQRAGRTIVMWTRDGHSCVMSAPDTVDESELLSLAAWDAGGDVPF